MHPGAAGRRVHPDRAHVRQVDHHAAVANRMAGDPVPTAAHRDRQPVVTGEVDCGDHIGHTFAAHDKARPAVDHTVPDTPSGIVLGVARPQNQAPQGLAQREDGRLLRQSPQNDIRDHALSPVVRNACCRRRLAILPTLAPRH